MDNVEKLITIRKSLRWTQQQMADALQIDRSYLSQLENRRAPLDDYYLREAERVGKLNTDVILKEDTIPYETKTVGSNRDILRLFSEAAVQEAASRGVEFNNESFLIRLLTEASQQKRDDIALMAAQELAEIFRRKINNK